MTSGILKGGRPRLCPAPGQCSTCARPEADPGGGGQGPGRISWREQDSSGQSETEQNGPRGGPRSAPGSPTLEQGPAGHGRRGEQALGAAAPSAAHRGSVLDARCPATRRGLLELRRKRESSRRPLSQSPRRSSPEPPAASPG